MSTGINYGRLRLIQKIVQEHWETKAETKTYTFNEMIFVLNAMLEDEGKPYMEGTFTLKKGYNNFRMFVQHLLYRNLANYDSLLCLTGTKGSGKSSAAIMLAKEWCRLLGITFDPRRHMAYNNADLMSKIDLLNKFEVIICLSGKTKINIKLNNKEYKETIANLTKLNNYEVLTYDINHDKFVYQKPKKTSLTYKAAEVYEIKLENGQKITATPEHLFLTKTGYKKLKDLTNTDEIVMLHKKCFICNKEFYNNKKGFNQKYCSKECAKKGNSSRYFNEYKRLRVRQQYKKHYDKNKLEIYKSMNIYRKSDIGKIKAKDWREKNKAKIKMKARIYWLNNKKKLSKLNKEYRLKNKDKILLNERKYYRNKFDNDIHYKINHNLSSRMFDALKNYKDIKISSFVSLLGCSIKELKLHLEKQFKKGMTWENYGIWHVDHIKPCAKFNLLDKNEQKKCFNYNNLQPLWGIENCSKGAKYDN